MHFAVFLFTIPSDNVVPKDSFFVTFVVIGCSQIQLVIYYTLLPLTILSRLVKGNFTRIAQKAPDKT